MPLSENPFALDNAQHGVFVSVIIPVFNDPSGIAATLSALTTQDYPPDRWEVLVVDNNSTDNTLQVAQSFTQRIPSLRMLTEKNKQSSYVARNRGIEAAQGEILAFLDADVSVDADWIRRGVANFTDSDADYVGCRVEVYTQHTPPTMWEMYDKLAGFHVSKYMKREGFAPTACLFVRKSVINRVGSFQENLVSGGDNEFGTRVRQSGFNQYYDDCNVVRHPARAGMRSMWNKHYRIGKGHWDVRYLFPDRYGPATFRFVARSFRPAIRVGRQLDGQGLSFAQSIRMRLVINVVHLARGCGRLVRFLQTKLRLPTWAVRGPGPQS